MKTTLQHIPDPGTIEGSFRPNYEYNWPQDLPSQCEMCTNEFKVSSNLKFGPPRAARVLRKISKISLISSLSGYALIYLVVAVFGSGNSLAKAWIACVAILAFLLFLISPILFFSSIFLPEVRQLECTQCGWSRDYPIKRLRNIRIR
ncbi:MAG: hypothetical protein V4727_07550 [Verrucomicrobiota bacterium]